MNQAEKKIKKQRELLTIKSEFIKIGFNKMPLGEIIKLMPKKLKGEEAIKWARKASNVWNGRSMEFEKYFPVFLQALEILKHSPEVQAA